MKLRILTGDWIEQLRTLPDQSVHCCVTSPPYWGLRDYGVAGQLGLEKTPEEYVEKMVDGFGEVKRVLRDDGTIWVNLGDSYTSGGRKTRDPGRSKIHPALENWDAGRPDDPEGLKPKDLVGIPWRVAFALQQPYYTGRIKRVEDRIWLAAMLEAEGCLFIHKRKIGQSNGQGYERKSDTYSPGLEIANTHEAIVKRCIEIAGIGSICTQSPEQNQRRKQKIFRWNLRTTESRELVRELYPYLVAKQHQARVFCGCPTSGRDAEAAHAALKLLHNGSETTVDFPEPPSVFEKGWYLRSDIIWKKPNPMPESVTDRPTKAHEYIFLLSKHEKYYYDSEAIKEPVNGGAHARKANGANSRMIIERAAGRLDSKPNPSRSNIPGVGPKASLPGSGIRYNESFSAAVTDLVQDRNKRTVWTVATSPYNEAHFATFPPDLIKPCILAGCPVGGIVLDPFFGSGTTGQVALELGRKCLGIELNPKYVELAEQRCSITPGLSLM